MKTRICIYARVSTQGQDYQRQLTELREYAERMNYEVVREFSEKISGAKTIAERQALTDLLDFAATNHIDKVLVYECSRISRRAIDFLQVIEQLTQMHVSVYILQNGLETLMADGSECVYPSKRIRNVNGRWISKSNRSISIRHNRAVQLDGA